MSAEGDTEGSTSDLSIDEILLLDSIDWEPVDFVCGVAMNLPTTRSDWTWSTGEVRNAWEGQREAVTRAARELTDDCRARGGHGVVGVRITIRLLEQGSQVYLQGTAVRPRGATSGGVTAPFASDLSARDFVLLDRAGYRPLGLAFGAAFIHVPGQGPGNHMALSVQTQNVELTTFTKALYQARELAMIRMQDAR